MIALASSISYNPTSPAWRASTSAQTHAVRAGLSFLEGHIMTIQTNPTAGAAELFEPIAGWRDRLAERLIANAPKTKHARAGYLSALYCLKAHRMPSAYCRQDDTAALQNIIDYVIARLDS